MENKNCCIICIVILFLMFYFLNRSKIKDIKRKKKSVYVQRDLGTNKEIFDDTKDLSQNNLYQNNEFEALVPTSITLSPYI